MNSEQQQPSGRRILIVDHDRGECTAIANALRAQGYEAAWLTSPFRALERARSFDPDVVITGLQLPGLSGLDLMHQLRLQRPGTAVVVLAPAPTLPEVVEAIKLGADDVVAAPVDVAALLRSLECAASAPRRLMAEGGEAPWPLVVGRHPSMESVLALARRVAPTRASLLLTGESGTGKGVIAELIHRAGGRADRPFIKLSCASLAESVLESELFGHERGAFTGAVARREGRFMAAHRGTLYLDEVVDIPPATQVKLLRVIQDREFERVGGNETLRVDVRLVAATNRDPEAAVAAGRLREDLFYRLNVVRIHLPPLRDRRSDVAEVAAHFLERFARENRKPPARLTPAALACLLAYDWPGNVRELEHAMESALVISDGRWIGVEQLPRWIAEDHLPERPVRIPGSSLAEIEREAILKSLEAARGNTAEAAAMLGVSRRKIQYRLREYSRTDGGGRSPGDPRPQAG